MSRTDLATLVTVCSLLLPGIARSETDPVFDVREQMNAAEYQASGLSKLSKDELSLLNHWLSNFAGKLFRAGREHEKQQSPRPVGMSSQCFPALESSISGSFNGWKGETVFKLANGQVWEQSAYGYGIGIGFNPKVVVFPVAGGCKMRVEGFADSVPVRRLK